MHFLPCSVSYTWCITSDLTFTFQKLSLGRDISCCLVSFTQDKDLEKAVDAFSRAVQIDPENGEAWNNIACLYAPLQYIFLHYYVLMLIVLLGVL